MIILDTNVLSALMRQIPESKVISWLDRQPRNSIWITSVTVLEVRFGLQIMQAGKRQTLLLQSFEEFLQKIGERVAAFNTDAARHAADLMATRHKKGRPGEFRDTMIAGIAIAHHATLATRNAVHFQDIPVPLVNPWLA